MVSTVENRVAVNLGGLVKRFGSGWRVVTVLSNGNKWTKLQYAPRIIRKKYQHKTTQMPIFKINGRLPRKVWDALPKKELI